MKLVRASEDIDAHYENGREGYPIYERIARQDDVFVVLNERNLAGKIIRMYKLLSQNGKVYYQHHYWFKEI